MTDSLSSLPILPIQGDIILPTSTLFDKRSKIVTQKDDDIKSQEVNHQVSVEGMDSDGLKEVFLTLLEKGLEMIPEVGSILAPLVSIFLGEKDSGNEAQKLMQKSLDRIESKIDALSQQVKDSTTSTMISHTIDALKTIHPKLDLIWKKLNRAQKFGDGSEFRKTLENIGLELESSLNDVHALLASEAPDLVDTNGNSVTRKNLDSIRAIMQDRVQSSTYCWDYTIMRYKNDIDEWLAYISDVQTKGAALLILHQKARLIFTPKTVTISSVEAQIRQIVEDLKDRIKDYKAILLGHILDYPSSKLLINLSENDPNKAYPRLFTIKDENSGLKFKTGNVSFSQKPIVLTSSRSSSYQDGFGYKDVPESQDLSSSFGFVFNKDTGKWNLRASRFKYSLDHPSRWTVSRDDEDVKVTMWGGVVHYGNNEGVPGEHLGLFGRNFASFKVIPHASNSGEHELVTLVLLDKEGNKELQTWNVRLEEVTAATLQTNPNSTQIYESFSRRSTFDIHNYISVNHALVLQDTRIRTSHTDDIIMPQYGQVYADRLVCLHGDALNITWAGETGGLTGYSLDLKGIVKFRLYRLRGDVGNMNKDQRKSMVSNLLYFHPSTGKLSLKEEGAEALEDIFIQVWNPTGFRNNTVSSTSRSCDDPEGVLPMDREVIGKELQLSLDDESRIAYQNDQKNVTTRSTSLIYTVSGGAKVSCGQVNLHSEDWRGDYFDNW